MWLTAPHLGKGRVYMVSQEKAPHQTLSQENVSFPNMHSSKTDGEWDCHTKMCEKKSNKIECLIKMHLHRMALFFRIINIWCLDTWTWPSGLPWMHVYSPINHVYCYEFIITKVAINAWIHYKSCHQYITIYTVNCNSKMGQISHNVPNTTELHSLLCNPHYHPPRSSWLVDSW